MTERPEIPRLGERFTAAVAYATAHHAEQRRKGTNIPYSAHLLGVTALVLEDGGDEDDAIAGMLHDVVEDGGGPVALELIRVTWGERVAFIVDACSDTDEVPKPPWRQRKEEYLAHLVDARDDVLRVSLADKLHNARALQADYRAVGPDLWKRFNSAARNAATQLWYYRSLVDVFAARRPGRPADELAWTVGELERLVREQEGEAALTVAPA